MPQSLIGKSSKLRPLGHCEWCGDSVEPGTASLAHQTGPDTNYLAQVEQIATSMCGPCHRIWLAICRSTVREG